MPHFEMILEKVSLITDLPVDRKPVIEESLINFLSLCYQSLDVVLNKENKECDGNMMKYTIQLINLAPDDNTIVKKMDQCATDWMLYMIGGMMLANKFDNLVHCMHLNLLSNFDLASAFN
ncbi:hypothetical protein PVK06_018322 [Gossypium arboreum]|uniref:Uncharacterized protein n=1 Tax=Gossypium arboreum TaxID=29729 RepID=A0ABR0Q543_GOSAR|nr:hypothetical protein PVK06_018322 [Gossypium arboreum]